MTRAIYIHLAFVSVAAFSGAVAFATGNPYAFGIALWSALVSARTGSF